MTASAREREGIAALVLAAGAGTRFGGGKLMAGFAGEPLLWHAVRAAQSAPVTEVVVVAAPGLALPPPARVPTRALTLASDALSISLKAGIAALARHAAAFVFLGDMPLIPPAIAPALAALLGKYYAALPRVAGQGGHPVLLSRRAFADVLTLTGDAGAGRLLRGRDDVAWLDTADPGVLLDIDRPDDLLRLERAARASR